MPVTYVVFDLFYEGFRSVMDLPLGERWARLRRIVGEIGEPPSGRR